MKSWENTCRKRSVLPAALTTIVGKGVPEAGSAALADGPRAGEHLVRE